MAKFNLTTQPGYQQGAVEPASPVEILQHQTPQVEQQVSPEGSLDDLLTAATAVSPTLPEAEQEYAAPVQVPSLEEQRATEATTPINLRKEEERVDTYERDVQLREKRLETEEKLASNYGADGGINARAQGLIQKVTQGNFEIKGLTSTQEHLGRLPTVGPIIQKTGAITPEGGINPQFLGVTSYITENFFAEQAGGVKAVDEVPDVIETIAESPDLEGASITRAQGNEQLGQQIHHDWQRYNGVEQPSKLEPEEARILGDVAKEMYYQANKDEGLLQFVPGKNKEQSTFIVTKAGNDAFKGSSTLRKKYFPKEHVRPSKTPTPTGQLVGDTRRVTKGVTGKVKGDGKLLEEKTVDQARENLNKIPNVVNPQRMRVLFSTILPVLSADQSTFIGPNADPTLKAFAEIHNFGEKKFQGFVAQSKIKAKKQAAAQEAGRPLPPQDYDPVGEVNSLRNNVAQAVYGIAKERHGANFLTYDVQAFNGRLSPQQTHFNPTVSKAARFVSSNATPVKVTPGSRQEANLIQMYSLIIGDKGTDALLPKQRVEAMARQTDKLAGWGRELKQALNEAMTAEQAEAVASAIEQGIPVNDPKFPKFNGLQIKNPDLLKAIADKGEDGPAFIDGLIDFYDYQVAKKQGRPFFTFFNAYIDGKTNGIASNGIQLGSSKVALRTGVTRSDTSIHAVDNDIDIRQELANILTEAVEKNGFDGSFTDGTMASVDALAKAVFNYKPLNKATTMTYGYGKSVDSFDKNIRETIYELAEDPETGVQDMLDLLIQVDEDYTPEHLADVLFTKYQEGMDMVMGEDSAESRSLMWSAALANSAMDELMELTSHTGLKLRYGGNITTDVEAQKQSYGVEAGGESGRRVVRDLERRGASSAAKVRTDDYGVQSIDIGGLAWGGSIPGPVQSLDAATVAMTVTGKSWEKLRHASHGNPYIHQIYDAFKMDANGYDVVLQEVNRNWLKAALEWSYLEQTWANLKENKKKFNEKLSKLNPKSKYDITPDSEWQGVGTLVSMSVTQKGGLWPTKLQKKLEHIIPPEVKEQHEDAAFKATQYVIDGLKKRGFNVYEEPTQMTPDQIKFVNDMILHFSRIEKRLPALIAKTNKNKQALAKELGKQGPVLQYYTH